MMQNKNPTVVRLTRVGCERGERNVLTDGLEECALTHSDHLAGLGDLGDVVPWQNSHILLLMQTTSDQECDLDRLFVCIHVGGSTNRHRLFSGEFFHELLGEPGVGRMSTDHLAVGLHKPQQVRHFLPRPFEGVSTQAKPAHLYDDAAVTLGVHYAAVQNDLLRQVSEGLQGVLVLDVIPISTIIHPNRRLEDDGLAVAGGDLVDIAHF